MGTSRIKFTSILIITLFLGFIAASLITLVYAHGGDTSSIHGCVRTGILNQGRLRVIDANGTCNANEIPLDWPATALGTSGYYQSFDKDRDNGGNPSDIGGGNGDPVAVLTINSIPAGSYIVTATTEITNVIACSFDSTSFTSSSLNPWSTIQNTPANVFTEAVTLSLQGNITLYCQSEGEQNLLLDKAALTAIKLTSLN